MTSVELAKIAGVSQSTISRVMNDSPLIPDKTKEHVRRIAREYGFVLNSQAQSLKTNKTGTIGILFPRYFTSMIANTFFAHLYDHLSMTLMGYGYDIMVLYNNAKTNRMSYFEQTIQKRKIDGYIILKPDITEREHYVLVKNNVPYVSIFKQNSQIVDMNTFTINSYEGGILAGKFFGQKHGSQKIYLGLEGTSIDNTPRVNGFLQGMRQVGCTDIPMIFEGEMSVSGGYDAIRKNQHLFTQHHCIYVYNDMMALGAINALILLGLKIPEQVELIGTDDIPMATQFHPTLSTLKGPVALMIQEACATLVKLINKETISNIKKEYSPELIHRETTILE
ncbi:LacI family DNA-binding transcriptional regulator [Sphaerochaeta sp.]|uniref:LacI family DNA-binding transcriptional regulator n=1 Tax=Sphaerochaeta sp. TaxID=1972642 RepID=UPI002FCC99D8